MTIEVLPGELSQEEFLDFDWYMLSYEMQELKVQLNFTSAIYVSANSVDRLRVTFTDFTQFIDLDNQSLKPDYEIEKSIPTQV